MASFINRGSYVLQVTLCFLGKAGLWLIQLEFRLNIIGTNRWAGGTLFP